MAWYHFCRSFERDRLPVDEVFSPSERQLFAAKYDSRLTDSHALTNFVAWRRSALYTLVFFSTAFNCLSIGNISDAQNVRQEYLEKSRFVLNYTLWAEEQLAQSPRVPCAEIDKAFAEFLNQTLPTIALLPAGGVTLRSNPARTCSELTNSDAEARCAAGTGEVLKQHVLASPTCGWKVCSRSLSDVCPAVCSSAAMCQDTREESAPSYLRFSSAFLKAMMYRLRAEAAKTTVVNTIIVTVLQWLAVAGVVAATVVWSNWRRSWPLLLGSWLLTFLTPFVTSTLPTRLFMEWGTTTEDLLEFLRITQEHYNVEERVERMLGSAADVCNENIPDLRQNWDSAKGKVEGLCRIMKRIDIPFTGIDNKGRDACNAFPRYADNVEKGIQLTQQVCDQFNRVWQRESGAVSSLQEEMYAVIRDGVEKAKLGMEMLIGLTNAMSSFKQMWPAAVSMAPGIIKGAVQAKIIVPEASMPGVFIVLLPWLYTPLTWSMYNILMQVMGDGFMLVSLFTLAFYPLAYSIIGWIFNMVSPMEQQKVKKVLRYLSGITNVLFLVTLITAIVAIKRLYDAYRDDLAFMSEVLKEELTEMLVIQLVHVKAMVVIALSVVTKIYLTTVTAVDWMMRETAMQRRYEEMLREREGMREGLEGSVLGLYRKRQMNLDALLILGKSTQDANAVWH